MFFIFHGDKCLLILHTCTLPSHVRFAVWFIFFPYISLGILNFPVIVYIVFFQICRNYYILHSVLACVFLTTLTLQINCFGSLHVFFSFIFMGILDCSLCLFNLNCLSYFIIRSFFLISYICLPYYILLLCL